MTYYYWKKAKTKYGFRSFDYVGLKMWNGLHLELRCIENMELFKKKIKTMLLHDTRAFYVKPSNIYD